MTLMELLLLLLVAGVCGAIGRSIAGAPAPVGCLATIGVGFVGALLGAWLARELDLPEPFPVTIDDVTFPIVWSIVGSSLFLALLSLLTRSRRRA